MMTEKRWLLPYPSPIRPPHDPEAAVEIPLATKMRLGLDDDRSWIILTEANRFTWPGPDLLISMENLPGIRGNQR